MEGDEKQTAAAAVGTISIHTLRMEGDTCGQFPKSAPFDFNPHPPYGGWLSLHTERGLSPTISIHTLRMEGDKFV